MSELAAKSFTLNDLPELRRRTDRVAAFLRSQLAQHLETLRPVTAPERILGRPAGGKVEVAGSDAILEGLRKRYAEFTRKPYDLPTPFDDTWLTLVGSAIDIFPWEFTAPIGGATVTITSPVRWILNYRSNYSLAQVRAGLSGLESVRPEYLRQFVVNSLMLQTVLTRLPALTQLLADLRFELKVEAPPELRGLSVVTVSSCLPSSRPSDDVVQAAVGFSGIPAFVELIDLDALKSPRDPLRERLAELLR